MNSERMPSHLRELPEPNPVTRRNHKREVLWQITLPFIVGFLMLAGLAALLTVNAIAPVGRWAEISTIFLILPLLLLSLIPLALFGALAYLIILLIPNIPPYARLAQDAIRKVERYAKRGADMAAEPILQAESFAASIGSLFARRSKS